MYMSYRKITVCTTRCPYCGKKISKEYGGREVWGPKYGRCPNCKGIFKTGMKLYSDISPEEREKDKKEVVHAIAFFIPAFVISVVVAVLTGWELVGLLAFFFFMGIILSVVPHFQRMRITLKKYRRLQHTDPELYQLEYEESLRLTQKWSNTTASNNNKTPLDTRENSFCRKCGERLPPNSQYCNKCGTQIFTGDIDHEVQ